MLLKSTVKNTFICIVLVGNACSELVFNNLRDKMALELLRLLPDTNLVVSALMVRFPLCKLATIATGDTKTELMTVLGYTNDTWMLGCYARFREFFNLLTKIDLTYTTKIFVNYTENIDPAFIINSEINYGLTVDKVGFNYPQKSVQFINQLINAAMFKRIPNILDAHDVDHNTSMIIVNAIHFKGTWEFPFNYKQTKAEIFHQANGKVFKVPMMQKIDSIPYIDVGEFQSVKINLGSSDTSIMFMLPFDRQGLPDLINKAYEDPDYFKPFIDRMQARTIKLKIPRFEIKTYVDLEGFLQELGLYGIFNCTASGLLRILKVQRNNNTICLSKMKQKTFIQIDEMGVGRHILKEDRDIQLQPSTTGEATLINSVDFTLNRPFLFFVNLHFTHTNRHELLMGTYYGPESI